MFGISKSQYDFLTTIGQIEIEVLEEFEGFGGGARAGRRARRCATTPALLIGNLIHTSPSLYIHLCHPILTFNSNKVYFNEDQNYCISYYVTCFLMIYSKIVQHSLVFQPRVILPWSL